MQKIGFNETISGRYGLEKDSFGLIERAVKRKEEDFSRKTKREAVPFKNPMSAIKQFNASLKFRCRDLCSHFRQSEIMSSVLVYLFIEISPRSMRSDS